MLTLARICLHKGVSVPGVPYLTFITIIVYLEDRHVEIEANYKPANI